MSKSPSLLLKRIQSPLNPLTQQEPCEKPPLSKMAMMNAPEQLHMLSKRGSECQLLRQGKVPQSKAQNKIQ